jgi:hypothetical protein
MKSLPLLLACCFAAHMAVAQQTGSSPRFCPPQTDPLSIRPEMLENLHPSIDREQFSGWILRMMETGVPPMLNG